MLYEVKDCKTGKMVELDLPMAEAPPFGEFEHNGCKYQRFPSCSAIKVTHGIDRTGGVKAWSMPRKGSPFWKGLPDAPHYDKDGFAVFRGQREIDRWLAKGGGKKWCYDKSENVSDQQEWVGKPKRRSRR